MELRKLLASVSFVCKLENDVSICSVACEQDSVSNAHTQLCYTLVIFSYKERNTDVLIPAVQISFMVVMPHHGLLLMYNLLVKGRIARIDRVAVS